MSRHLYARVLRLALVVLALLPISSTSAIAAAIGLNVVYVNADIITDTTWTPDNVYVVQKDVRVVRRVTLSIDPGTVVKFAKYADLKVEGALKVGPPPYLVFLPVILKDLATLAGPVAGASLASRSVAAEPVERVVLTSLNDDTFGGDINDDPDEEIVPAQGDWGGIVFEEESDDAESFVRRFAIRYSGEPRSLTEQGPILLNNASPTISDGQFHETFLAGVEIDLPSFNTNWYNDVWDIHEMAYHLSNDVTVARANTLRISPGTVLKFAPGKQLIVEGTLQAVGNAGQPIVMTSSKDDSALGDTNLDGGDTEPAMKDWEGVQFAVESRANPGRLENVELRYTGRNNGPAIQIENCSPTIENITFVENYRNGARLRASGQRLGTVALMSKSVPYIIGDDLTIPRRESLPIGPGATLKFEFHKSLLVEGIIRAIGTPQEPILMTSIKDDDAINDTNNDGFLTSPDRGDWGGILFDDQSDDENCALEWVDLMYGGNAGLGKTKIAPVRLDNASPVLDRLDFENNWVNGVEIPMGAWRTDTWDNPDVVYFVTGDLEIPTGETLTVEPGVVVKLLNAVSPTQPPAITVKGDLRIGELGQGRVFLTSGRDDNVGPQPSEGFSPNWDSNSDGTVTAPQIEDWVGVIYESTADAASSYVRNAVLRYGGVRYGVGKKSQAVLRLNAVDIPVDNCCFEENHRGVEALEGAQPPIRQSGFSITEDYAVYNGTPGSTTVQATQNWWGDPTGPRSDGEGCNAATGFGDKVSCGVSFTPWLSSSLSLPWCP